MEAYQLAAIVSGGLSIHKLAPRVLGPTADYLGEEVKGLAEKGVNNLKRIFLIAEKKLGHDVDETGSVPPRVLKSILAEGYFSEDTISSEYLGGVLASSRTHSGKDDRGVYYIQMISTMSCYQLRLHYIVFRSIRHVYLGGVGTLGTVEGRQKARIFLPYTFIKCAFSLPEAEDFISVLHHSLQGLSRLGLVERASACGGPEFLKKAFSYECAEGGLFVTPAWPGFELFAAASGSLSRPIDEVLTPDFPCPDIPEIKLPFYLVAPASPRHGLGEESCQ